MNEEVLPVCVRESVALSSGSDHFRVGGCATSKFQSLAPVCPQCPCLVPQRLGCLSNHCATVPLK